jgi:hypothetical protein
MMLGLAAGTRLKSTVCTTEIMIITAPEGDIEITCGGAGMTDGGDANEGSVDPDFAEGTALGKRYISADGDFEVLCVKPGDGSLALGGTALNVKEAKKLPKTD